MDYSVSFVKDYCQFLKGYNMPTQELYKILDTSGFKMTIPFLRVKAEKVNRLFEYAIEKSGNENIGLQLPCEPWYVPDKVIYMLMWNSKSPLDAIRIACKYVKLITTTFAAVFTEDESKFSVEFTESSEWLKYKKSWRSLIKTTLDVATSTMQNTFPKMFNRILFPLEVRFTIDKPADDEPYYNLFKCPVYFNDKKNIMVYDKSVLQKENNQYFDKRSFDNIITYADDLIRQQLSRTDDFSIIVENEILSMIGRGVVFPNIEKVSKNFGMSIRTFQRKMEQDNINYKDLLDSVRKSFALNYINQHTDFNVTDLAFALGYSDPSSFIKAFKRWYGVTPGKFSHPE